MQVLLVLGVVSLFLSTSEGLEAKKGKMNCRSCIQL